MFDFLKGPFAGGARISPVEILVRLVAAAVLGGAVALVYRRSRPDIDVAPAFPPTLVLLAILIAMVTQVVGDNVARAFSLVGALSIVRFRTVVRDTQDTAYVILAVVAGTSIGASAPWMGAIGIGIVACVAFLMKRKPSTETFRIESSAVSKYRIGLSVLDYAPLTTAPAAEPGFGV